ncbi:MAG: hypothetical protein QY316_00345 [Thermodesulfobacteriota bacterium]|nr:MAG: hypothetical protein QY316_00345 [Thermodesulfobacteriota bacterium]
MKSEEGKEIQVLQHDEVPGYRTAFYIVFAVAVIYFWAIISYG